MMVLLELPLLERAMEEAFGDDAIHAQLRDVSGFSDATFAQASAGKPAFAQATTVASVNHRFAARADSFQRKDAVA